MNEEYLQLEHHINKYQIKESLNIVRQYIENNDLILVGGEAINFSLKTKGKSIYNKYTIADYDCISPDFYTHSKNVANILCSKNFSNVSVIPAIHNTTVRVKVSNYTVFDSTYCPKNVYDKIETIQYSKLKIIHPNYQIIDQYNSLSFLFDQTGESQNIYHRMKKDIERNRILVENFPILSNEIPKRFVDKKIPIQLLEASKYKIYNSNDLEYIESEDILCCHGFIAYSIYYQSINDIYFKYIHLIPKKDQKEIDKLFSNVIQSSFIINDNNCIINIPEDSYLTLINGTNELDILEKNIDTYDKVNKKETYNKLLEVKPITKHLYCKNNNYEILDLSGRLLSCNLFEFENNKFIVSNYNYLLSYYLVEYHYNNKPKYYLSYYLSMINIINISKKIDKLIKTNVLNNFNYSISTYGKYNFNDSLYYFICNFNYLLNNNKNSEYKPPKIYTEYPICDIDKEFDKNNSIFFNIDGKLNNSIVNTNFINILKNNNII